MKLRTSCFKTVFLKDLTRFAPVWAGYTLALLLGLGLMAGGEVGTTLPSALASSINLMAVVNLGYGFLTAQLLLGDLCSSRLCFGLHTLPLTRGQWFGAHILSGTLFSLAPSLVMTAAAMPILLSSTLDGVWKIGLYWLLAANLQYILFFSLGVLTMILSGSRIGSGLLYGVLNFAALGVYLLINSLFIPLFYGFVLPQDNYMYFSPVAQMVNTTFIQTNFRYQRMEDGSRLITGTFFAYDNWWYLWVCAGVGILVLLLALELYRRRNLETAGDTVAFPWMKKLFLVLATLGGGILLHLFLAIFVGIQQSYLYLFLGMILGWFAGLMLLHRSLRVFRWKALPGLFVLLLLMGGCILFAQADPLDWETRLPEQDQIESVILSQSRYDNEQVLTDPEDIQAVLGLHAAAARDQIPGGVLWYQGREVEQLPDNYVFEDLQRTASMYLVYNLKDGGKIQRLYYLRGGSSEALVLRSYLSNFRLITGFASPQEIVPQVQEVHLEGMELDQKLMTEEVLLSLLQAVEADCLSGTMAQNWAFHNRFVSEDNQSYHLSIELTELPGDHSRYFSFSIYADCENTLQWLREHMDPPVIG